MSPYVTFTVVLMALGTNAQSIDLLGKCDQTIDAVRGFIASAYLGRWYEQYRYAVVFQVGGICVTADYSLNKDGRIKVVNTQVNSLTNQLSNIVGTASFVEDATVGKMSVRFPVTPVAGSYWVLATDYKTYALVYSCTQILVSNAKVVWILTRDSNPAESVIQEAVRKAREMGIDTSKLNKTRQGKDCIYAIPN